MSTVFNDDPNVEGKPYILGSSKVIGQYLTTNATTYLSDDVSGTVMLKVKPELVAPADTFSAIVKGPGFAPGGVVHLNTPIKTYYRTYVTFLGVTNLHAPFTVLTLRNDGQSKFAMGLPSGSYTALSCSPVALRGEPGTAWLAAFEAIGTIPLNSILISLLGYYSPD